MDEEVVSVDRNAGFSVFARIHAAEEQETHIFLNQRSPLTKTIMFGILKLHALPRTLEEVLIQSRLLDLTYVEKLSTNDSNCWSFQNFRKGKQKSIVYLDSHVSYDNMLKLF